MTIQLPVWKVAMLALAAYLVFGGPKIQGCSVLSPPPFVTDHLAVVVIEESADHGKYTADQLAVIGSTDAKSVKALVESKKGEFHVLDKDDSGNLNLKYAPKFLQEAAKVVPPSLPWIMGATPSRGFSMKLESEQDVLAKVGGL